MVMNRQGLLMHAVGLLGVTEAHFTDEVNIGSNRKMSEYIVIKGGSPFGELL